MRRTTDVEFVVGVLDGQWRSSHHVLTRSLEVRGTGMTVNSRVSNARERGYAIEHRHDATAGERDHAHLYKLHGWFPPCPGCHGIGIKHLADVGWACRVCKTLRRDMLPATAAEPSSGLKKPAAAAGSANAAPDPRPEEGPASAPASGPPICGGSSEDQEDQLEPEPGSWFAERAPAVTRSEAAGSTPAPRSPAPQTAAAVISLLERRGFLEATDQRVAELEPDPDQASLFDDLEEVA